MEGRRKFIKLSVLSTIAGLPLTGFPKSPLVSSTEYTAAQFKPQILSTWNHGMAANDKAWEVLGSGGTILDAVEQGVMVTENDLRNLSVGLQGLPDREGIVTLDASIMKGDGSCGAVAFVRQVKHPISLARKVMEKTPHVMIVGEGARQFALSEGVPMEEEKLSPNAKEAYNRWKEEANYQPIINIENHDTIGMIGLDKDGSMAGSCTTSGLAYKMHGRVGDSPIIGAGLFVDDTVGAATATGLGEEVIRICGAFLIVELMRQGRTPQEACEEAVKRAVAKSKDLDNTQIGFLAMNKEGSFGAHAIRPGFNFAQHHQNGSELVDSGSWFK
ncbi:isoaspartyl peptidase/L-asparaginase family protein [Cyclobacterium jeungdonense]|uniref:N(4)-(Beta-N-acetylglucosaminyl)-L-asparaginase n=1 Tax=Cyclobacterium jeungdonense TaxID=708087 RepID=A0ABT8CBB2_9BACT|nr:N(4)-(beta-N-acetylglucosaminyl)-L-asparaginase [Cyclobacterium jeungdonense]MDN3689234.1 N(4)-(beta-N-acetylglucosaminyl)-L-asparaginase [Cyclobacterium jeungdonense]